MTGKRFHAVKPAVVVLLLIGGCATSPEEQRYNQHMQELLRAYDRGELSDEGFRRAVRELDYLRPTDRDAPPAWSE